MTFNQILENFQKVVDSTRKIAQNQASEQIRKDLAWFFVKYADMVGRIEWKQYTEYWNDGEECEFKVYQPDPVFKEGVMPDWVSERYDETWFPNMEYVDRWLSEIDQPKSWTNVELLKKQISLYQVGGFGEFSEDWNKIKKYVLEELGEVFLEEIFGDHKSIIVYPERVSVEKYEDHD